MHGCPEPAGLSEPAGGRAAGWARCFGPRERGWEAPSPIPTLLSLLTSRGGRAHVLGALVLPFGALIDGWPLEATCPLLCATWCNLLEKGWMDTYSDLAWLFCYPQQTEFREEQQKIASRPEGLIYKERLGAKFV